MFPKERYMWPFFESNCMFHLKKNTIWNHWRVDYLNLSFIGIHRFSEIPGPSWMMKISGPEIYLSTSPPRDLRIFVPSESILQHECPGHPGKVDF